jgi:hypothetical protein
MNKANIKDIHDWIEYGTKQGWISEPFCNTHEGDPYMTEEEQQQWEEGGDPCLLVIKVLV